MIQSDVAPVCRPMKFDSSIGLPVETKRMEPARSKVPETRNDCAAVMTTSVSSRSGVERSVLRAAASMTFGAVIRRTAPLVSAAVSGDRRIIPWSACKIAVSGARDAPMRPSIQRLSGAVKVNVSPASNRPVAAKRKSPWSTHTVTSRPPRILPATSKLTGLLSTT